MDFYAADYARQSSATESGSEASTSAQHSDNRRCLERYAPKRVTEYEDLGKSGYKDDVVRKEFDRMIADCRAGRINLICVTYMSRLTRRQPKESLPLLLELLGIGVVIVSVNEGEFRDDDKNSIIMLITLVMRLDASYQESANKSKHISAAKALAKLLGGYPGGNGPFGFDLVKVMRENPADGRTIQIQIPVRNDDQAAIIQDAWHRIKDNMSTPIEPGRHHPGSLSGISVAWNKEGVPTRGQIRGKKRSHARWRADVLRRILMHPWLAGFACEPVYGVRPDGGRSTKIVGYEIQRDPETTLPIIACEPILDPAEWWQLQAWLGGRGQGRGRSQNVTALSGIRTADGRSILVCECGRPMNSVNNNVNSERTRGAAPSYRCTRPRGAEFPGQHDGGNSINQHILEPYLAQRIFALISTAEGDPEIGDVLYHAAKRYHAARERPETIGERHSLVAERADAVATLRDIAEAFGQAKSAIMRKSLMEQEALAAERLSVAERRLAEIDEATAQPLPIQEWLSSERSADPLAEGSWWSGTSVAERREWFALFLDNVAVAKSKTRGARTWLDYDLASRVVITWAHDAAK